MHWRIALVAVLSLIVVVSCDRAPVEPQSDQVTGVAVFDTDHGVIHRVSVGGADVRTAPGEKPADANLSLVAIMRADGSVSGQWQDSFGRRPPYILHMDVTCLNVVGTEAWISGVITNAPAFPPAIGSASIIRVVDNGRSRTDAADQASRVEIEGFSDLTSFDCREAPNVDLYDMNEGQVTVR